MTVGERALRNRIPTCEAQGTCDISCCISWRAVALFAQPSRCAIRICSAMSSRRTRPIDQRENWRSSMESCSSERSARWRGSNGNLREQGSHDVGTTLEHLREMPVALREHAGHVHSSIVDLGDAEDDLHVDVSDCLDDFADVEDARQHEVSELWLNCRRAGVLGNDRSSIECDQTWDAVAEGLALTMQRMVMPARQTCSSTSAGASLCQPHGTHSTLLAMNNHKPALRRCRCVEPTNHEAATVTATAIAGHCVASISSAIVVDVEASREPGTHVRVPLISYDS